MRDQRVCLTVHNFAHQGVIGPEVLRSTGLNRPEYYLHPDRMQDGKNRGALNLLKGGIIYSNFATTVSRHHAWEALHTDQGCGLNATLRAHGSKFGGVLNGVDYDSWNPEVDRFIACRYSVDSIDCKYANKKALRERFWLREGFKPIVAYIGRLDRQKGVHLVRHALYYSLRNGGQFVLLGPSPDSSIGAEFNRIKGQLNDNPDCHLELNFDPDLAHLVYAGADMLVMPSFYEPCDLVQMIVLKYGTVPIVRNVGGLAETVNDRDYSANGREQCNGYVFNDPDYSGIESAMHRAFGLWHLYPHEFRQLMTNGMRHDHSWNQAGQDYLNIYEYIRHK